MKKPLMLVSIVVIMAVMGCRSSGETLEDRGAPQEARVEGEIEDDETGEAEEVDARAQADEAREDGLVLDDELMEEWANGHAYRGRVELSGHLRFSWLTLWNDVDDYEKELVMRFFVDDAGRGVLPEGVGGGESPPVIVLYDQKDGQELVDVDLAAMQKTIDEDFEYVPDNFDAFQEGHVQQPGTLVMEGLLVETMADRPYFFGRFVSFEPKAMEEDPEALQARLEAQAYAAGPHHGPVYEEDFYHTEAGFLYAEPDEDSDRVAEIEAQEILLKIRTVDAEWYEVSLYSDEETTGFVRRDLLAPVN